MKHTLFIALFIFLGNLAFSQPTIQWQHCYGGSGYEYNPGNVIQTMDGGYVVVGGTQSDDDQVTGNHYSGQDDYWIIKISSTGALEWEKCLGGSYADLCSSVRQTYDSGYIVAGYTASTNGDVTGNHGGNSDAWIVKLSSSGELQWEKCYGGSKVDGAECIQITADSGYIFVGYSNSNDGDVTGNHGGFDIWVVKLSSSGSLQWDKCYGGSSDDYCSYLFSNTAIIQTNDGGYIISGNTLSNDGEVSGNHGGCDIWVVKISDTGKLEWQQCYGGSGSDVTGDIIQTTDSGYVIAGATTSNDGDVTGYLGSTFDSLDGWLLKLSKTGAITWNKTIYIGGQEQLNSLKQKYDGSYYVAGTCLGSYGGRDVLLANLNSSGSIEWIGDYGGSGDDYGTSIVFTNDSCTLVTGYTFSNNNDVSGNHGNTDYWVVKLYKANGINNITYFNGISIYPNPANDYLHITDSNFINNIVITNIVGQIVYSNQCGRQNTDINVATWQPGLYFVTINGSETGRFIKE